MPPSNILRPGCKFLRAVRTQCYSTEGGAAQGGAALYARLPPKWMAERNVLVGAAFNGVGLAVGAYAFGAVVPMGVLAGSLVPMALGTVYMRRDQVEARALVTSATCLPVGMVASSLLDMAAWPLFGTAWMLVVPALAAGYSCYHIAESKDMDMDLVSTPTSPFCRLLHTVGLWSPWAPWAHQPFRDTFKLFFWYFCLGAVPAACSIYSGYQVWLMLVLAWEYALCASVALMTAGFFAISMPSMVPPSVKGNLPWLLPMATRWGHWSLNNYTTNVLWIYSFYAFLPMILFLLGFKWKYGVSSSPFKSSEESGGSLFQGQRAFWVK